MVVEETGVRRWLEAEGRSAELESWLAGQARKREFAARVKEARDRLASVYAAGLPRHELLAAKHAEFERLRAQYGAIIPAEPNNAFLVSIAVYSELVPAFERCSRRRTTTSAASTRRCAPSPRSTRRSRTAGAR